MKKDSELTKVAKILGRSGGNATFKKHGVKHYKDMTKKRWASVGKPKSANK